MTSTVTTSGVVRLRSGSAVRVGSQVSGIVLKLNVTVGSQIRRGDTIALIDPKELEARADQARAQLAMDRVAVAKAERDVARIKSLAATGAIAKQQQEDLVWQLQTAAAKQAKSESDLKAALVELSYTIIRAPISGIVSSVSTQEGETVAASFAAPTFVTIVEDNALELVAMVDETDIAGVAPGNSLTFTVEAYPSREFTATVLRIDPTATIVSGVVNYPVIARIDGDLRLLRPDMTANIVIETATRSALVIPAQAIQRGADGRFVYLLKGKAIERRVVTTGTKEGDFTEIVKGVGAADQVLTRGWPESKTVPTEP
ncbi:MAG: efflux RND transporter periplasmic adaptor subunit [Steroidobacteraceae bacterium]